MHKPNPTLSEADPAMYRGINGAPVIDIKIGEVGPVKMTKAFVVPVPQVAPEPSTTVILPAASAAEAAMVRLQTYIEAPATGMLICVVSPLESEAEERLFVQVIGRLVAGRLEHPLMVGAS